MHGSTIQHGGGVMVVGGCCSGPIGPAWLPQQGASFIIKQDNEPKHTFRLCQGYLTLMVMEYCVLHPIERGWDEMELRVEPKEATRCLNKMKRSSRTGAAVVKAKNLK